MSDGETPSGVAGRVAPSRLMSQAQRKDRTMYMPGTFTVTEDHIKLLQRSYFDTEFGAYEGAVVQSLKRPYGNSDVIGDLYEILRSDGKMWDEDEQGEMPDELVEGLRKTHREMAIVVQILAVTAGEGVFRPGVYHKRDRYDQTSWERVA